MPETADAPGAPAQKRRELEWDVDLGEGEPPRASKEDPRRDTVDVERLRARRPRGGFRTRQDYNLRGGERRGPRG